MCAIASVVESGLYPSAASPTKRVAHAKRGIRDIRLAFRGIDSRAGRNMAMTDLICCSDTAASSRLNPRSRAFE